MHWIYLVAAVVCLLVAAKAGTALALLLVLAALGLMLAWILGLLSARVAAGARNEMSIISPEELRALREQAEARKAAGDASATTGEAPAPPAANDEAAP